MNYGILKYERIRNMRIDLDFTQKQVAEVLNIAQNTLSQYENGVHQIPIDLLVKLADYYNTSVDYLLGRTDQKAPYPPKM